MKAALSKVITAILRHLPDSAQAILLRKAVAISNDRVKFRNGLISMFGSIENLREAGYTPQTIIDVGANVGDWARTVGVIFPNAAIRMIEAQPELGAHLERAKHDLGSRAHYDIALLGAEPADDVAFYKIGTGSSVFEEATNLDKDVVTLSMGRLDDLGSLQNISGPIFLKLDVQGYELEVLKGGERVLAECEVVLMEVSLLPYNKGAPLMPEVAAFMDARGFTPYDFCGQLRRVSDRALFQIDVIFVRKESALRLHRRYSMFEPEDTKAVG
jgi:FkbM family methyltransferase